MNSSRKDRMVAWLLAIATWLQAPVLAHLARLDRDATIRCLLLAALLAAVVYWAWVARLQLNHRVDMALVMLAAGGLGMIIGWWIDIGSAPVAACCASASPPGEWSFLSKVWSFMTGLMLLAAIPPSLVLTRCAARARGNPRLLLSTHILGNTAMVAGMILVNRTWGRVAAQMLGSPVVGAHVAMLVGMVGGMVAGMWLGEAVLGLRPWRDSAR